MINRALFLVPLSFVIGAYMGFVLFAGSGAFSAFRPDLTLIGVRGQIERIEKDAIVLWTKNRGSLSILPRRNMESVLVRLSTRGAEVVLRKKREDMRGGIYEYKHRTLEDLTPGDIVYAELDRHTPLKAKLLLIPDTLGDPYSSL